MASVGEATTTLVHADYLSVPAGLSKEAKQIIKSYGGWEMFLVTYGLDVHKDNDRIEGKAIVEGLASNAEKEKTSGGRK